MDNTVVALFDTRRAADLAVEHLVQQHGIDRTDIFVRAARSGNSAGTKAAGADVESGHRGVEADGEPELAGPIEVSVDCDKARQAAVRATLREAGATSVPMN